MDTTEQMMKEMSTAPDKACAEAWVQYVTDLHFMHEKPISPNYPIWGKTFIKKIMPYGAAREVNSTRCEVKASLQRGFLTEFLIMIVKAENPIGKICLDRALQILKDMMVDRLVDLPGTISAVEIADIVRNCPAEKLEQHVGDAIGLHEDMRL